MEKSVLAALLLAVSFDSYAGGYVGGSYLMGEYSEDGISSEAEPSAIFVRLGKQYNEHFAVEGRIGVGSGDDSMGISGHDVDIKVQNFVGVYALAGLPTETAFYPYAVLGVTRGKLKADADSLGFSDSGEESDLSYGVGFTAMLSKEVKLSGEYLQYIDKSGGEFTGLSFGLVYNF